jgi:hypothetical protein
LRSLALWRPELPNDVIIECKAIFSSVLEGILTVTAPDARQKSVRLGQTSPETLARILADELETERRKAFE